VASDWHEYPVDLFVTRILGGLSHALLEPDRDRQWDAVTGAFVLVRMWRETLPKNKQGGKLGPARQRSLREHLLAAAGCVATAAMEEDGSGHYLRMAEAHLLAVREKLREN
jgi:hypothetical protein